MNINENISKIDSMTIRDFKSSVSIDSSTIDCSIGDPEYDTDELIKKSTAESVLSSDNHYCDARGIEALRIRISQLNPLYGKDEIIVTAGASEALAAVLFTLINKGDRVILFKPFFPLYATLCEMVGAQIIELDTQNTAWQIDPASLMAQIGKGVKAILLNTPNNPSGVIYHKQSLDALIEFIEASGCYCIVDEVYRDFCYVPFVSLCETEKIKEQLITIRSFSKSHAMCGYRLGYLLAHRQLTDEIIKVHQSWMTSLPVFVQKAGLTALDIPVLTQKEKIKRKRNIVYEALIKMGAKVICSDGGFYLFFKIKNATEDSCDFCRKCAEEARVLMIPGIFFHQEGYVRISVIAQDALLKEAMKRLKVFLENSGNAAQSQQQKEDAGDKRTD